VYSYMYQQPSNPCLPGVCHTSPASWNPNAQHLPCLDLVTCTHTQLPACLHHQCIQEPVSKHMTTPAVTIPVTAGVQEAADLMLARKIRRLPVVDDSGYPVGILSR
jgi:signal-transduction protein with cAMP-binding, CBS, and nucleotidyltransferase domain